MKRYSLWLIAPLVLGFLGCSNSTVEIDSSKDKPASTIESSIEVNSFSLEQLFQFGGGGCGMILWKPETIPHKDGILFFHGLGDSFLAIMVLDGEVTGFNRIAGSGKEFYGQQTAQTFRSEDGKITIQVDVTLGRAGEIESVSISKGTIIIKEKNKTKNIAVVGDAGC